MKKVLIVLALCDRTAATVDGRCSVSVVLDDVDHNIIVNNESRAPFTPLFLPMPVPYAGIAEAPTP